MTKNVNGMVDIVISTIWVREGHFTIGNIYLILDIAVIVPGVILVSKDVESLVTFSGLTSKMKNP